VGNPDYEGGEVNIYGCATSGTASTISSPPLLQAKRWGAEGERFGGALTGFRIYDGSERRSYLAIGIPGHECGKGKVVLHQIDSNGTLTLVHQKEPADWYGNDEFGYSLAIFQRPYSDDYPDKGGLQTYIAIGMPGTQVDGVPAGRVVVWRLFDSDGSLNTGTLYIDDGSPDSLTDRFGRSIAVLQPFESEGGFVVGAPEAFVTSSDGGDVQAGRV
jgi:hypothetical protein